MAHRQVGLAPSKSLSRDFFYRVVFVKINYMKLVITKLRLIMIILATLVLATGLIYIFLSGSEPPVAQKNSLSVKIPAFVGTYYPEAEQELATMLDDLFAEAPARQASGVPQIIVSPHAGYKYSGVVAARAFKSVANSNFSRVIILASSHSAKFNKTALADYDIWRTPLGDLPTDKTYSQALLALNKGHFSVYSAAFEKEHSVEVLLPLIKYTLPEAEIVPILMNQASVEQKTALIASLSELMDKNTLIVVSTDLSHYPNYDDAKYMDNKLLSAMQTMRYENVSSAIAEMKARGYVPVTFACALEAVEVAMRVGEILGLRGEILRYANSGDAFPETRDKVVGYGAMAFVNFNYKNMPDDFLSRQLNEKEKSVALRAARQAIVNSFAGAGNADEMDDYPIFKAPRGVFVTLRKNGQLRGCMGNLEPDDSLYKVLPKIAVTAAFGDPRFEPVLKNELTEIQIEISVLTTLDKIKNPEEILMGTHGVMLKGPNGQQGVYLPQVAVEQDWSKQEFLNSLCRDKAGLPRECWQDDKVELYKFTAQVFEE